MLEIRGVHAGYGPVPVIHDVSIEVAPGSLVALLGPNGAGKTTTARVVAGLHRCTAGSVHLDGVELTGVPAHRRVERGLSLVPESRGLFPNLSVRDNLILGAYKRNHGNRTSSLRRVYTLFPVLEDRAGQLAGSMSGGQQQMLAIGRALMSNPRYLLLDEPSLGLAPMLVTAILDQLADLVADGVGVLLVEQNAVKALAVADRAVVLERGRILLSGPAGEVRDDPQVVASYLGGVV